MNSSTIRRFALPTIIVLGVLLRIYWFCCNPSLWIDEAAVANSIVKYSAGQLCVKPLDNAQMAPVGFLLVEKLFGSLGNYSESSLRLFSLLSGIAALVMFWRLARQLCDGLPLVFAVALFSFSGPLIYHSSEVKQYETEVLAAVVILWLVVRLRDGLTAKQALAAGVAAAICVWFAFSSIFVIAGALATLWVCFLSKKEWQNVARIAGIVGLALASFVAYYIFIIRPSANLAVQQSAYEGHFAPWPVSLRALLWYARTGYLALGDPFGVSLDVNLPFLPHSATLKYLATLSYPAIALCGIGVYQFWKDNRTLGCLLGSPLVLALVASLLGKYPLLERHFLFFVPSFCLLLAKAVEAMAVEAKAWPGKRQLISRALVVWTLLYVVVNLGAKVARPALFGGMKHSTMREAIRYINEHYQKGDEVYILWNAVPFYTYYGYRYDLNWSPQISGDPRIGAHSLDEIRARVKHDVQAGVAGHARTWFLMEEVYSLINYTDEKGVTHDIETPTADLYQEVLSTDDKGKIPAKFIGHGAAAYLVVNEK